MAQKSARKGVLETLQAAGATSGNGTILAIPAGITKHTFTLKPDNGTFTTGKVFVEAADDPAYTGTWIAVAAEVTLVSNTEVKVTFDGVLAFVRARISAAITGGGTMAAFYQGSN
jgi:hypothetical protein